MTAIPTMPLFVHHTSVLFPIYSDVHYCLRILLNYFETIKKCVFYSGQHWRFELANCLKQYKHILVRVARNTYVHVR